MQDDTAIKDDEQPEHIGGMTQRGLYALDIAGVVTDLWDERLEGWQVEQLPGEQTRITGFVRDQSELYGVLAALRNMGLTLVRVEPVTDPDQTEGEIV